MKARAFFLGLIIALALGPASAEKSADFFKSYQDYDDLGRAFLDKIEPKTGAIDLPNGVHLDLRDKFYFLDHDDAVSVLTEGWGNPASSAAESLGMIFPAQYDPLAKDSWASACASKR